MSALNSWKGGPLTYAQCQAIQAEASANGEMVFIDTVISTRRAGGGTCSDGCCPARPCTTAQGPKPSRRSDKRRFASYPERHGKALVPQWPSMWRARESPLAAPPRRFLPAGPPGAGPGPGWLPPAHPFTGLRARLLGPGVSLGLHSAEIEALRASSPAR